MADTKSPAADLQSGKSEFIWKGPIYETTAVPTWYYVALVLIAVILGVAFYLVNQPLSIVVVAASLFFFLTHANEVPKAYRYHITDEGITIEDKEFRFQDLKNFWISASEKGNVITLYVEQAGRFTLPLSIPLRFADQDGIRTLLRRHLPESRRQGDLIVDILARMTGIN